MDDILSRMGTDATKWAEEFCKIAKEKGIEYDEDWMIGWFSNALCAGEESRRSRDERDTIETLGMVSSALASRAGAWDGNGPDWFPEPPEWLDLWQKAFLAVTADEKAPDYQEILEAVV